MRISSTHTIYNSASLVSGNITIELTARIQKVVKTITMLQKENQGFPFTPITFNPYQYFVLKQIVNPGVVEKHVFNSTITWETSR